MRGIAADPAPEEDWPQPAGNADQEEWEATLASLDRAHEQLCVTVAALSDRDLHQPVVGKNFDTYVMLHGVVQHTLYHAGQIALLKCSRAGR